MDGLRGLWPAVERQNSRPALAVRIPAWLVYSCGSFIAGRGNIVPRSIRIVLFALAGVLALVALAVGALVLFVNPNDYREDVSRLARDKAGVELKLGGELGWSFYPVLGFRAQDVGLALRTGAPQLVQVDAFSVGVRLLPLLSQKIEVDALDVSGLRAHLIVDANGNNNWQPPQTAPALSANDAGSAAPAPAVTGATTESSSAAEIHIPKITVRDSQIRYEDKKAGLDYIVDVPVLELTDVSLGQAFPLLLQARVRDGKKLDLDLALQAQVKFDPKADVAEVKISQLQVANVIASGQVSASALSAEPQFSGKLATENFDLKALLKTLAIEPPSTQDADALTRVQVDLAFSGTPQQIRIAPLQLKLDDSTLSGEAAITDVATQAVRFDLKLDRLDVDRYLPPESKTGKTAAVPATGKAPATAKGDLIPVEALRGLNVKGTFNAGEVVVKKIPVRDVGLSIRARNGDVQLNDLAAKLLQGSLAGNVGVDVRGAQPKIATKIDLNNLQLKDLLAPFVPVEVLSGRSSLNLNTSTQGNDMDTLLRQALGQLDLNLADGVLHGVNLNQVVVDALKQKMGDFTVLMPDYETRLPKALKGDTQIRNLLANMKVENGHLLTPGLNAQTDAGEFKASGDIDLVAQSFDYRFGVVLSSLADHKYLKGAEWPVRCRGSASIPVQDWCRPDMGAIGGVLQKAAGIALREKATEKLGEKLGIKGASEAEVKQQVQQKAQEKVNEQLNKQFDKLFKRSKKKEEAAAAASAPAAAPEPSTAEPSTAESAPAEQPAAETAPAETPAN